MQFLNLVKMRTLCFCFGKLKSVFCDLFINFVEVPLNLVLNCLNSHQCIKNSLLQELETIPLNFILKIETDRMLLCGTSISWLFKSERV